MATALAELGRRVEVWHYGAWPGRGDWEAETVKGKGVVIHALGEDDRPSFEDRVDSLTNERSDTLFHLHNVLTPRNPRLARRLKSMGFSYLVSPHGTCAPRMMRKNWLLKKAYRVLAGRPMLAGALAAIALSDKEEDDLRRYGHHGTIRQVPNGVNQCPPPTSDDPTTEDPVPQARGAKLALYSGRLEIDYKRLDRMIDALSAAPTWHLAFAGADWDDSVATLKQQVVEAGVSDRVHFLGCLSGEELWSTYRRADLLLLLSKSEGLSMALLEALSCGTPALVSPEVAETLELDRAGWCCLPEEAGSLLAQLSEADESMWRERSLAAHELSQRFSWRSVAERYANAVDALFFGKAGAHV